jgi:hypothetical protein
MNVAPSPVSVNDIGLAIDGHHFTDTERMQLLRE